MQSEKKLKGNIKALLILQQSKAAQNIAVEQEQARHIVNSLIEVSHLYPVDCSEFAGDRGR